MIQCTARSKTSDVQCGLERGHAGPHSVRTTLEVPDGMAPFFADLWADLQQGKRNLERQQRNQRVLNLTLLAAACIYIGLTLGEVIYR